MTLHEGNTKTMGRTLEIVVVDDDEQITELLKTCIRGAARESRIHAFNDSMIAKEYVGNNPVDVLIVGYIKDRLDGFELMNSAPPEVTRVTLSGDALNSDEEKLTKPNSDYFKRPIPIFLLGEFISEQQGKLL